MQNDCEIYVDPEEDEVFFGCISEKERSVCAKFVQREATQLIAKDIVKSNHVLNSDDLSKATNPTKINVVHLNDSIDKKAVDNLSDHDSETSFHDAIYTFDKTHDFKPSYSNNTAIEIEHSYSSPVNHKIDKTILATPKSVVKADRDGGFLKVLSEIALVKAEVEADKKNDEDKENKIIPKINIIEATPEKDSPLSPPKINSSHLRRFRIIYNSPNTEANVEINKSVYTKSINESFETAHNLKNKILDHGEKNFVNVSEDERCSSVINFNQCEDLIDFNASNIINNNSDEKYDNQGTNGISKVEDIAIEFKNDFYNDSNIILTEGYMLDSLKKGTGNVQPDSEFVLIKEKNAAECVSGFLENNKSDIKMGSSEIAQEKSGLKNISKNFSLDTPPDNDSAAIKITSPELKKGLLEKNNFDDNLTKDITSKKKSENALESLPDSKTNILKQLHGTPIPGYRFSREARKIVEVLKKTAANDTLDFSIQEFDVERIENSFVSPEPVSFLNETVVSPKSLKMNEISKKQMEKNEIGLSEKKILPKPKTVEKDRPKAIPISQSKIQSLKCFSDRRVYHQTGTEIKNCVKKLPFDGKKVVDSEEKAKACKTVEKKTSAISSPEISKCCSKSKIPLSSRVPQSTSKITPGKTPGKIYKNPKFKNIESPINAYIHNKPTALVLNVKPETNKNGLLKLWKTQTMSTEKKPQDKKKIPSSESESNLPFVAYKSAPSFHVEKRTESRLPRLAPSFQKLIVSHSPKILKHEGRFYVKTPAKKVSTNDSTIQVDPNEVSVVVSQAAQKSSTIK